MGCCGGRDQPKAVVSTKGIPRTQGVDGMTLIKYVGGSIGTQSWYGVVSGKKYAFGLKKNLGNVDPRDLQTGQMQRPGLLEVRENGGKVFVIAPVADPKPSEAEVAAFVEKPVEKEELPPEAVAEEKQNEEVIPLDEVAYRDLGNQDEVKEVNISVAAQKLADEYDVSSYAIQLIKPTGTDGKITVTDVRKYLEGR